MSTREKKLTKALVNTVAEKLGTVLFSTGHVFEKMKEGHQITESELAVIKMGQSSLLRTLRQLNRLGNSDLGDVPIKSDKLGFCPYIDLDGVGGLSAPR